MRNVLKAMSRMGGDRPKNPRVLVTGSTGFIGTHLVNALLRQHYSVVGIDLKPPEIQREGLVSEACDMRDSERLLSIL